MSVQVVSHFRTGLVKLAAHLKEKDIETIKFLLGNQIGEGSLERAHSGVKLFQVLVEAGVFSEENLLPLRQICVATESSRLVKEFDNTFRWREILEDAQRFSDQGRDLFKCNLTGFCLSKTYRRVLNLMTHHGDKGNWKSCYTLVRRIISAGMSYPPVLLARIKIEYAVVLQFQGELETAANWVEWALEDARNIAEIENQQMISTYAYHYLSIIKLLQGDTEESEMLLTRAQQCGFKLLDAEVTAHLSFAQGMHLTLQLGSTADRVELRYKAISHFRRSADLCRWATRETAGTEWCWLQSLTFVARHLARKDDIELGERVDEVDLIEAERCVDLVEARRRCTQQMAGQRKGELLAIKGCIAARRSEFQAGLAYVDTAKHSAQEYGMYTDYTSLIIQEDVYKQIQSQNGRKKLMCGVCIGALVGLMLFQLLLL